jgi:ATP-dependent helicase HrpA
VRPHLVDRSLEVVVSAGRILAARHAIEQRLDHITATPLLPARLDVRRQLARLLPPGFVAAAGAGRLGDIERYLRAIDYRLDRLSADPARDAERMRRVQALEDRFERAASAPREARWMLEELRVSLFAQSIGTPQRVSEERVGRAIDG